MATLTDTLKPLTEQYNDAVRALQSTFDMEKKGLKHSERLKLQKQYSDRYEQLAGEYRTKRKQAFTDYQNENPEWKRGRQLWKWFFIGATILLIGFCSNQVAVTEESETASQVSALAENQEIVYWNADNIRLPYLEDSTQYVSNPDYVLTQAAVDTINYYMGKIEQDFNVQTVVIVVNHIEGDDPYRMAQDVGNRYGVGYGDRGLMVVVGYQDHSINISPGRSLEGDLTDAECRHLQQEYVIPGMRAEQPDSAMIYLSRALYAHLKGKELPQMSSLMDGTTEDDGALGIVGLTTLALTLLFIFFTHKNKQYNWTTPTALMLMSNPFIIAPSGSGFSMGHSSFGGGHSGFGGGGGFSGGSFGGGSFGGGGATSRW